MIFDYYIWAFESVIIILYDERIWGLFSHLEHFEHLQVFKKSKLQNNCGNNIRHFILKCEKF